MAKAPTNSDLGNKIDSLTGEVNEMNIILLRHDKSLNLINKRHELIDAGKAAVTAYKKEEAEEQRTRTKDGIASYQLKAWHLIVGILAVLSAIAYAIAASRGIKP